LKKRYSARLTGLLLIMAFGTAIFGFGGTSYAANASGPDVTLYIRGDGARGGPIFSSGGNVGDGFWYPGKTVSGILRIQNNYSQRVKVNNLGLTMQLERLVGNGQYETVTDPDLKDLFAQNMELTIKRGILPPLFDETFLEMLNGYDLSATEIFYINRGGYVDLKYTVHMKESAGNELQGLKATVAFLINSEQASSDRDKSKRDIDDHWAHDCIETLLEHGIIDGYPDGTIRPDDFITRAEVAVLIGKALGLGERDKTFSGYIDPLPGWARGYIISVTEEGIYKGYPGRLFRADKNITREEIVATLVRAFLSGKSAGEAPGFDDWGDVSGWASDSVSIAVENGIVEGYPDNTFQPQKNVTRAEAFTMVCKLLGYHETH